MRRSPGILRKVKIGQDWCSMAIVLGALFTAMAILTKGIFTLLTITSGLLSLWAYQKQWSKPFSIKWLAALILSLCFAAPELGALYVQFGQPTASAGLQAVMSSFKFFFWDSQFGRFFDTGPIRNAGGHPLFFVRVFLWAYLPWTIVFFAAMSAHCKALAKADHSARAAFIFLSCAFLWTFLLFSASKFQMAYYIDIILPFAAILCARFLDDLGVGSALFTAQMLLLFLLALAVIALSVYVANFTLLATILIVCVGLACFFVTTKAESLTFRAIVYSVLVADMAYVFLTLLTALTFTRYDIARNAVRLFGQKTDLPIYVYRMPEVARELALYTKEPCHEVEDAALLHPLRGDYYLVVRDRQTEQLRSQADRFRQLAAIKLVVHKTGTFDKLLRLAKGTGQLETIDFMQFYAR